MKPQTGAAQDTKGGDDVFAVNTVRRLAAAAVSLLLCGSFCGIFPAAASAAEPGEDALYALRFEPENSYSDYYDAHAAEPRPDAEILLHGADYTEAADGDFSAETLDGTEHVLIWQSAEGAVSYEFDVPESGCYAAEIRYYALESPSDRAELSLSLDGALPFDAASRISLSKRFVSQTGFKTDARGNQIRPAQIESPAWQTRFLYDRDGLFNTPLLFSLSAGHHTLTLTGIKASVGIDTIRFCQPPQTPAYQAPSQADLQNTPAGTVRIEGEDAAYKSAPTLSPAYDRNSCMVSPSDPVKTVYNTIGGANWNQAGQAVTWEIPAGTLPGDGWYQLGIKARQDVIRGFYSNRRLLIDGSVPSDAFSQLKFYYDTDWSLTQAQQDGETAYLYLTANEPHTLTLEAIPGEIGDTMRKLEKTVAALNTCYQQILMVTGPNPDPYNDYYVEESIPTLLSDLRRISQELRNAQDGIEQLSGVQGSEAAALQRMYVILDKCTAKPTRIPKYVRQIKDNLSTISAFIRDRRSQPLEIDYIELASPQTQFAPLKAGFFRQLGFRIRALAGSFTEDYNTISDAGTDDAIEVWVNLGRDQALAVRELVENDFALKHPEIPVSVNLVAGGVVEATLAGKGPDVALFLGGEFPVNLACRGLLTDLTQFDGYEEAMQDFHPEAAVQYQYQDGVYGMPLTQSWTMMFYRKDILTELGFTELPRTWDDLIGALPALQRKHLGVGLILPSANVAAATEPGHTFASMLLQQGLNYYNDDQTRTTFDTVPAIQCFEKWTDLYRDYKFMQVYDAYSYFRTGQYPIVIANYSFYNQLSVAAPEIRGLWDFTVMPGTEQPDGTVCHASNSSGTGAVIFNKVKNKDAAWEFVRWFSSAEVQAAYGSELEGLMGQMGRYEAANTKALSQLNWSQKELSVLTAQRDALREIPVLPASYAVTRNIMNAFRETVNSNENPRDTLMYYNSDINDEIRRKRENLGIQ